MDYRLSYEKTAFKEQIQQSCQPENPSGSSSPSSSAPATGTG